MSAYFWIFSRISLLHGAFTGTKVAALRLRENFSEMVSSSRTFSHLFQVVESPAKPLQASIPQASRQQKMYPVAARA